MSWTPTDEQVEKVSAVLLADYQTQYDGGTVEEFHDLARAVLVAVGPHIAAQGIREYVEAARENPHTQFWSPSGVLDDAEQWADETEKEAGR